MALTPTLPRRSDATMTVQGFGDNRGSKYALSHLQSSKFPLCVLVMELSAQLEARAQRLEMTWIPREGSVAADRLSNGDCRGFDETNLVQFHIQHQNWLALNDLIAAGQSMSLEREKRKNEQKTVSGKLKRQTLREREPW